MKNTKTIYQIVSKFELFHKTHYESRNAHALK